MASVLKVTADGHHTSPILRGAWISKNIVGVPLSPPPENVEAVEPDLSKAVSIKEQIAAHRNNNSCNACHKDIDPYGFALEGFDPTGQFRTKYRVNTWHGKTTFTWRKAGYFKPTMNVDTSSDIHGEAFNNVQGLKDILISKHKNIAYNFVKNFYEYFNGKTPTLNERLALLKMIHEDAEENGMQDLIVKVILYSTQGENREFPKKRLSGWCFGTFINWFGVKGSQHKTNTSQENHFHLFLFKFSCVQFFSTRSWID